MFSGGFVLISFYCMYCVAIEYFCSYYFIVICVVVMNSFLLLIQTHIVEAPDIVNGSQVPMGEVYSNHREWSIQFNKQVSIIHCGIYIL